jgi:hypothetical protein
MIISWKHEDHADSAYGKLMEVFIGSEGEAKEAARTYVPCYSPIGICEVIK